MPKQLLIVFVKNFQLGKVKTRLAKVIGNTQALNVYQTLVFITEKETQSLNVTKHIYFSEFTSENVWQNNSLKFIQKGVDLGDKMYNAFKKGFEQGYEHIILIGSDLPDISSHILEQGFKELTQSDYVLGPATDGGYYLIGMKQNSPDIFTNKPWSTNQLLKETLTEIKNQHKSYTLLNTLNDIDTFDDLKNSTLFHIVNQ